MIDASELDGVIYDLSRAGSPVIVSKIAPIVSKGALNIKNKMQSDVRGSVYFSQIASTINYDLIESDDGIEAEVGPNPSKGGAASLAGIAYFGSSRPGGGTVSDPVYALEEEAPRFVQNLAEVAGFIFK